MQFASNCSVLQILLDKIQLYFLWSFPFKIHKNYHSWTKYDNKKGSVIFFKWKPNAIEITYYMYLQRTQNCHPELGHKWLEIPTPTSDSDAGWQHMLRYGTSSYSLSSATRHMHYLKSSTVRCRKRGGNRCPDSMPPAPTIVHRVACSVRTMYGEY